MGDFKIDGHKVRFGNGTVLEFEFPISQHIACGNLTIILLLIPSDIIYNQNVFALSESGQIIWQIEKLEQHYFQDHCPFNEAMVDEQNLIIFNWCDYRFSINPLDGKVLDKAFTK